MSASFCCITQPVQQALVMPQNIMGCLEVVLVLGGLGWSLRLLAAQQGAGGSRLASLTQLRRWLVSAASCFSPCRSLVKAVGMETPGFRHKHFAKSRLSCSVNATVMWSGPASGTRGRDGSLDGQDGKGTRQRWHARRQGGICGWFLFV